MDNCCGGVTTQAYGQPGNPVSSSQVKEGHLAILTAAPFCGLPQPEAHSTIWFNDKAQMRRAGMRFRVVCRSLPACHGICLPSSAHIAGSGALTFRHSGYFVVSVSGRSVRLSWPVLTSSGFRSGFASSPHGLKVRCTSACALTTTE